MNSTIDTIAKALNGHPCVFAMLVLFVICVWFLRHAMQHQEKMEKMRLDQLEKLARK
nr:hypothetical protein [Thiomonas sp.]